LPDVGQFVWPESPLRIRAIVLNDYLSYSRAECSTLRERGAKNIRLSVDVASGVVTTSFVWPPIGKEFVRTDAVFDDFGTFTGGLRALGIIFEEDIGAGVLDYAEATHGSSQRATPC
jgi:hypothetical protein